MDIVLDPRRTDYRRPRSDAAICDCGLSARTICFFAWPALMMKARERSARRECRPCGTRHGAGRETRLQATTNTLYMTTTTCRHAKLTRQRPNMDTWYANAQDDGQNAQTMAPSPAGAAAAVFPRARTLRSSTSSVRSSSTTRASRQSSYTISVETMSPGRSARRMRPRAAAL